jgi:hypothetical protein
MQRSYAAEADPYASANFWPMIVFAILVMAFFLHPPQLPRWAAPQAAAVAAPARTPVAVKAKIKVPPRLKQAMAAKGYRIR